MQQVPHLAFDPAGSWTNTYRIEVGGAGAIGLLRLERIPQPAGNFFLKILQETIDDEGRAHEIDALAQCRADNVASLVSWKLASRFFDLDGEVIPGLSWASTGQVDTEANPVTSDWCLFEAVQRLSATDGYPLVFELVDGLRVRRGTHGLWRPGDRHLVRVGPGALPWNYVVDEAGRLLTVSTGTRTYVLDEDAAAKVQARYQRIYEARTRGAEA